MTVVDCIMLGTVSAVCDSGSLYLQTVSAACDSGSLYLQTVSAACDSGSLYHTWNCICSHNSGSLYHAWEYVSCLGVYLQYMTMVVCIMLASVSAACDSGGLYHVYAAYNR